MEDKNENSGTFCFPISEPTPEVAWKHNDKHLELTYRNGIQCCLSHEPFYAENGFIDLVLRIEISQDGDYVNYVSNYKSLLNCTSNSPPVIIDTNFDTQVKNFSYIDFKKSNFSCVSNGSRITREPPTVPVGHTVTCTLNKITCLQNSKQLDCVNKLLEKFLFVNATLSSCDGNNIEGREWKQLLSTGTPVNYSVTTRSFEWKSPPIPEILRTKQCKLRFQLIMLNQVVAIKDKTTLPTADFTVETNCNTAAGRCTSGRGICNHITLKCDCSATCGALNVRYEGDQCDGEPWCRMNVPWIAVGIGSFACLITAAAAVCRLHTWWKKRRKHGYIEVPSTE